jgi:kynurenine formamidase
MRFIDLSATIAPSRPDALPFERVEINYSPHAEGTSQIETMLKVPPDLLRNNEGWAVEEFTKLATHSVTHVDAPWHYNSVIRGRRAATIDELPLEWFFSDGVVLDITCKDDGEKIEVTDLDTPLSDIGHNLKPLDIVLIKTKRDDFYGQPDYVWRGCAVTSEATRWLYDRGVRVMGIDAWGWDGPLDRQAKEALARREKGVFWAAHQCDLPYSQIERTAYTWGSIFLSAKRTRRAFWPRLMQAVRLRSVQDSDGGPEHALPRSGYPLDHRTATAGKDIWVGLPSPTRTVRGNRREKRCRAAFPPRR